MNLDVVHVTLNQLSASLDDLVFDGVKLRVNVVALELEDCVLVGEGKVGVHLKSPFERRLRAADDLFSHTPNFDASTILSF
jgi:hypothetical protein